MFVVCCISNELSGYNSVSDDNFVIVFEISVLFVCVVFDVDVFAAVRARRSVFFIASKIKKFNFFVGVCCVIEVLVLVNSVDVFLV